MGYQICHLTPLCCSPLPTTYAFPSDAVEERQLRMGRTLSRISLLAGQPAWLDMVYNSFPCHTSPGCYCTTSPLWMLKKLEAYFSHTGGSVQVMPKETIRSEMEAAAAFIHPMVSDCTDVKPGWRRLKTSGGGPISHIFPMKNWETLYVTPPF